MTQPTGIAGAMSYQPRETNSAPNECATCGKDLGEGGRTIAAATPGTGLVQYCSKACAPTRSPAEEWQWMVERIRALEGDLHCALVALRMVDDDVRHHHRNDSNFPALVRTPAIIAVRAVLTNTDKEES